MIISCKQPLLTLSSLFVLQCSPFAEASSSGLASDWVSEQGQFSGLLLFKLVLRALTSAVAGGFISLIISTSSSSSTGKDLDVSLWAAGFEEEVKSNYKSCF